MSAKLATPYLFDLASILRLHIVAIAMAAALVFSWLMTESYAPVVALLGGVDWLLINLLNRISDVQEDTDNEVRGTAGVAANRRAFFGVWVLIQTVSLAGGALLYPDLLPFRVAVQVIGIGYSYPIVPTPWGMRRLKEIYFAKNFMSSMLFVLTVFIYPLAAAGFELRIAGGAPAVALLILFFVSFELTYEILYDLRDLPGDRRAGIPTYPVVHGETRARQIIDALLLLAAASLTVGIASGLLGFREALFLGAPVLQLLLYRPRLRRGLTSADCINLTHFGTGELLLYLAGTAAWAAA